MNRVEGTLASDRPDPAKARLAVMARVALWGILGLAIAGLLVAEFRRPLNSDSAWLLYLARRVVQGDRLYVDLVEINPPLIVWLQLPVVLLARWLRVDPTAAFRIGLLVLIGVSLGLCARILRPVCPRPRDRRWILLAMVIVLLGWTRAHFGEREHMALAAMLPYLLASAAAAQGHVLGPALGIAVGAAASIGFGMKPHFLLVWFAALAYIAWRRRGSRWTLGAENWVVLGLLGFYATMVLLAAPDYLTLVRRLAPAYDAFARKSLGWIVLHSAEALCAIGTLLAYGLVRPALKSREPGDVLALASGAFLLAALVQRKGFPYHYYPISGCALLVASVALTSLDAGRMRIAQRLGALTLGTIFLLGTLSGMAWSLVQLWREDSLYLKQEQLAAYIRRQANDGSVLRLTYEDSFPLIDQADGCWTLRFPNLWLVQATYFDQLASSGPGLFKAYRAPAQMTGPERWAFAAVIEDFARERPSLLLVVRPYRRGAAGGAVTRFDYLGYFLQEPRFATALSQYRFIGVVDGYSVFQRQDRRPAS